MGLVPVLVVIGVLLLITIAVVSIVNVGQENAQARSLSVATAVLRRQAREPRWRQVPDDEDVPAGRTGASGRTRHVALAGTRDGRAVRVAVFASSRPAGTWQGAPVRWAVVPGLVVVVDAPELPGDLQLNPVQGAQRYGVLGSLAPLVAGDTAKKVFAQLESYQPPAVDVVDGTACFTFTDMDLAEQLDDLVAMACDVIDILVDVRKSVPPGGE
ncbi:hypothetical protein UK23_10800 [Lentzea aerocolonigenes]|uniref:Uncharacterized protein n=1 Tax=Lentzea aerocolonigenes TaxID=68170 RepID=A0A0F0H830_LENAE|nr:hypothetical protein [Lentzea aerocolonigenes]KJK50467.1 hypothetical protein UK23_10800 [Lentzea aerocolonigenes]